MMLMGLRYGPSGREAPLKTKYGRPSEVANAHVQSIMGLPVITGTNPAIICAFYEKLVTNIQTLE